MKQLLLKKLKKGARAILQQKNRLQRVFARREEAALPEMDAAAAEACLEKLAPIPDGTVDADNRLQPDFDLQIIVPCYNVEKTIDACVASILGQKTRYSFLLTLVNDGATDRTPELLERYRADPRVEILTQKNRGLSGARNRGMEILRGRYVMFVDSDDLLPDNALEALLSRAFAQDADIVQGGFENISPHGIRFGSEGYDREGFTAQTGLQLYGTAWAKVIRSSIFAHLKFPEGYWFEDSIFAFCIYPFCTRQYTIRECVYRYRRNPFGITSTSRKNPKAVDTVWITRSLMARLARTADVHTAQVQQLLLRQIALNGSRLARQTALVRKSAFLVMQQMYAQYYAPTQTYTTDPALLQLHKALSTQDFAQYLAACAAMG